MGRPRRVNCRKCNRHTDECGELSARGLCDDCGTGESTRQQFQLAYHEGPHFKRWRARSILSMGGIVPEDLKPYLDRDYPTGN